ncbi:MAG: AbrB/MazE/SpoVT family DNA-binding domain-containing protein [Firmicutes bacterium]|nr:AbrB/MazE/SpoVT family DNA-binding domain-containing protein [Bacillota bacterium]
MAKSTGIVREVDVLGRVVIPMELRSVMKINKGDPLEIFVDQDKIILKKYIPGCFFCGNMEELKNINGKKICQPCLAEVNESIG